ncbi:MAG: nitrate/TMAO reductase-like tetraheme cytochrome c subunit [Candidatus Krumholzibacteriia bacterium]
MNTVAILLFTAGIIALVAAQVLHRTGRLHQWKLLSLLAYFVFPVIFFATTVESDLHHMETVEFCASCHVMDEHVASLTVADDEPLASVHYRNNYVPQETACYACHSDYSMFGTAKTKMHGLLHVWADMTKKDIVAKEIELYNPFDQTVCMQCHGPSERFAKVRQHREEEDFLARSASGELTCFAAGCHDMAHLLPSEMEDEDDDDW